MDYFVIAVQLILSLSILVVLHELGHFIPAKLFKTKVEKFYLFFNPWFSLFKIKKGDTEYGVGWLPLGGYVKIAGMVDETETLKKKDDEVKGEKEPEREPEPWEFRSKPAWQRLIIMIGGIFVNMVLGIVIYAMVLWGWGEKYIPNDNLENGVAITLEEVRGDGMLQNGDKIISVGGEKIEFLPEVQSKILIEGYRTLEVERGGEIVEVKIPDNIDQTMIAKQSQPMFMELYPTVIAQVVDSTEAKKAGFKEGDSIVSINNESTPYFYNVLKTIRNSKGKEISVGYYRDGVFDEKNVKVSNMGAIGFQAYSETQFFAMNTKKYGFFEAFPAGWDRATTTLINYAKSLKLVFTKEGAKQVGGFGTIAKLFPNTWDWQRFWLNTALISIILAFMNFLPIPALDGGYILFLLFEMVTGIKPSDEFMEKANTVGFVILLLLLIYANGNDAFGFFK